MPRWNSFGPFINLNTQTGNPWKRISHFTTQKIIADSLLSPTMKTTPFLLLLVLPLCAQQPAARQEQAEKPEYIRVEEDGTAARLQTTVTTLEKDGVSVDLIGAIHIADKEYYDKLNERFKCYDKVLFEMVGGEKLGVVENESEIPDDGTQHAAETNKNKLSGLRDIYGMVAKFLKLTGQTEGINYKAKNFVHADLTMQEFEDKQKERNESLLGLALKASAGSEAKKNAVEPNVTKMLQAMLSGNSNMMKLELIQTLGQGDDQISMFAGETVILTDRNARCIEVLERETKPRGKLAVFYGAAHFPSMEKSLKEKGWRRSKEEWLTAWDVRKPARKNPKEIPEKTAKEQP